MNRRLHRVLPLFLLSCFQGHALAQDAVDRFEAALQRRVAKLDDGDRRVSLLLSPARDTASPRAVAARRVLAREPAQALWRAAQHSRDPRDRAVALDALGDAGEPLERLLAAAMHDRADEVVQGLAQRLAVSSLLAADEQQGAAVRLLGRYLDDQRAVVRGRAALALAALGDPAAIPLLRAALQRATVARTRPAASGGRAHVAFLLQTAYVRDYAPEIA